MSEIKFSLDSLKIRVEITEESVCEFEVRSIEIIQSEDQRGTIF